VTSVSIKVNAASSSSPKETPPPTSMSIAARMNQTQQHLADGIRGSVRDVRGARARCIETDQALVALAYATVPYASPSALAVAVRNTLAASPGRLPSARTLETLFETMFAASVHTEEGEPISFHVAYMDPADPDPEPPPRIRRYRWRAWRLDAPLPFDIPSLVKLAKASDPRSSSLAVYGRRGKLEIWGLIDQGTHYFDYLNLDTEKAQARRPGQFQASIEGTAHIVAWLDYVKIAELRGTDLVGTAVDALSSGPLYSALVPGLDAILASLDTLTDDPIEDQEEAGRRVYLAWSGALRRLLLRARNYRHGGAFLVVPKSAAAPHLNVKYALPYDRLSEAIALEVVETLKETRVRHEIFAEAESGSSSVDMEDYFSERVASNEIADIQHEINGAIWFVSLLTRVDGLVLLDPTLRVHGFGVEITTADAPAAVYRARNPSGSRRSTSDYNHYGTRHRSMMRLCAAVPNAVGFVISQDGAVRGMTAINGDVVMWDDLMVQRLTLSRRN
jgi:hypothetical protein